MYACMSLCIYHMHSNYLRRPECFGSYGTRVTGSCAPDLKIKTSSPAKPLTTRNY